MKLPSLSRFALVALLIGVASLLATARVKVGNTIKIITIPTMGYATVDLSAAATTSGIEQMAFDDNNNAAFSYWEGATHKVALWQNGAYISSTPVSSGSTLTLASGPTHYSTKDLGNVWTINTAGSLYAYNPGPLYVGGFWTLGQDDSAPVGPFNATEGTNTIPLTGGMEVYGIVIFSSGSILTNNVYYTNDNAANPSTMGIFKPGDTSVKILYGNLDTNLPFLGCYATAWSPAGNMGLYTSNGSTNTSSIGDATGTAPTVVETVTAGQPLSQITAINDSKDILVNGTYDYSTNPYTLTKPPYLLEGASGSTKKYFLANGTDPGLIPKALQAQIRNIYPSFISNHADSPTGQQPLYSMVFTAETLRSSTSNNWESGIFMLRKLADGTYDLHEITGVSRLQLKYLNKSGAFAALNGHAVLLLPMQINHADGTNQDQPMAFLPQWTPNNGSGRGQPIYHEPTAVLQMSSIGTTMAATFLGQSYTLTQNGSNPLLYQDATSGLSVLLAAAPLNDPSVQESLQATVNLSSAGVSNGVYICNETTASSNVFQDVTPGIGIALAGLDPATADTMTLTITGDSFSNSVTLTETGANTLTFTGSGITVQLVNSSTVGGTLYAALTYSAYGYSNTVMPIGFVSTGQYQNFAPPTSTDQTAESVDSFASFYIQLPVGLGSTPSVDLSVQVNGADVDFGTVDLVSTGNNMWRSAKKLVLLSAGADTSQMTSADSSNFQALQLPTGVNLDWTKGGGIVNVLLNGVVGQTVKPSFPVKAQANGVALESFAFLSWLGFSAEGAGIDVENRIRLPFVGLGYSMDSDYSATTPKTLSTYVTGGKQIWYSISHGNTYDPDNSALTGTPNAPFNGLIFKDATTTSGAIDQGVITATKLPAGLNYRLVICDGCCSAQTSLTSESASQSANTLLSNCSGFADKFGSKVAYLGWSWEEPPTVQQWTGELVGDLKGKGITVQTAYNTFLSAHPGNGAVHEMKIYGNTGAIIDMSSNPNATSGSGP